MTELFEKYENLKAQLISAGSVAVAFSGGVDSSLLLYAAKDALGEKAAAVTVVSPLLSDMERSDADEFCKRFDIRQIILEINPLEIPGFAENPADRCYICKRSLFEKILTAARENGFDAVAEGANTDDDGDYRPGKRATAELGILTPLRSAGLSKAEIRELSADFNLPSATKPSFACLATRFPTGTLITAEKLKQAEKAERFLFEHGFTQFRVRIHGEDARIEIPQADFEKFIEESTRKAVYDYLRGIGFRFVSIDINGYKTGNMNI
ncbi:MAG: ATP-dependent sacrificial sulfur transferase LarE [Clostridia bacterium]|nr:ATP-dependent sacrificial sulfur transferase LarE [Clostridia bacterium]